MFLAAKPIYSLRIQQHLNILKVFFKIIMFTSMRSLYFYIHIFIHTHTVAYEFKA